MSRLLRLVLHCRLDLRHPRRLLTLLLRRNYFRHYRLLRRPVHHLPRLCHRPALMIQLDQTVYLLHQQCYHSGRLGRRIHQFLLHLRFRQ